MGGEGVKGERREGERREREGEEEGRGGEEQKQEDQMLLWEESKRILCLSQREGVGIKAKGEQDRTSR